MTDDPSAIGRTFQRDTEGEASSAESQRRSTKRHPTAPQRRIPQHVAKPLYRHRSSRLWLMRFPHRAPRAGQLRQLPLFAVREDCRAKARLASPAPATTSPRPHRPTVPRTRNSRGRRSGHKKARSRRARRMRWPCAGQCAPASIGPSASPGRLTPPRRHRLAAAILGRILSFEPRREMQPALSRCSLPSCSALPAIAEERPSRDGRKRPPSPQTNPRRFEIIAADSTSKYFSSLLIAREAMYVDRSDHECGNDRGHRGHQRRLYLRHQPF